MIGVRILGTGSCVPNNIVSNDDLAKYIDTSDEWIFSRTGIKTRHISKCEDTTELSIKAAKDALLNSNIRGEEIELIIVATITADKLTPSTACLVQAAINADKAMAFDISAACTGFVYALDVATLFLKSGRFKNALIIGAETLSKIVDWDDRSTCVLFGDGAGAAVIEQCDSNCIKSIYCKSDGKKGKYLTCNGTELKNIYIQKDENFKSAVCMDGKEIFRFAVKVLEEHIEKILGENNLTIDDIDYIVPHQANKRIIESIAKKCGYDINKFYLNIDKFGNTSGASIILALDEMNKKKLLKNGMKIIIVGFGGGLTEGSALLIWNN